MSTADWLLNGSDHSVALVASGQTYTYAQLRAAAAKLLPHLEASGVRTGDRVGILGENSIFWVAAYLAILDYGATAVPFATMSTVDDLRRRQQVVACRAVFMDSRLAPRLSGAFPDQATIIPSNILDPDNNIQDDLGSTHQSARDECLSPVADAALMLTSGTTALPRAVRITHRNIRSNTESILRALDIGPGDRMLVILPFYYCFGTSLLHTHLRAGASMVLCNTFAYPETALDTLEATSCTSIAGVPSTFQTLLRNTSLRTRKLLSLRKVQQAGGKLPPTVLRELVSILPQAHIYTMYGQTEATARLSCLPPEYLDTKLGSIGRGIPGVKLDVLDEQGRSVRPGEVGEIVATGENVSPGYWDDPQATAERFDRGRLKTGDLATVDGDGFIYVVDRKTDFIKCMGHRVSSHEIESLVMEHSPDVVSASAVGRPDPVQGEAIAVFVTLRAGASLTESEILRHCRLKMARHMVPNEVFILDSLPLNSSGKVMKAALRQRLMAPPAQLAAAAAAAGAAAAAAPAEYSLSQSS